MRKSRHLSSPVHLFLHVSERFKFDAGKHYEASHNRVLNAVRSRYIHGVDSQLMQQVQQIATPYAAIIIISEMKDSCKMTTVSCIPSEHNDNSVEVNSHTQLKWVEQCHAAAQLSVHPACFAVTSSSQYITSKRTFTRRWSQAYNKMRTAAVQHVDVARVGAKKNLSRTEKFRELNRVLKDTADMSADLGYTVLSTL